jgi:glycosyltransferase involved in cell wall biosynthesis
MVDVATLRGLHSRLADIPWCVYFHENQFAYPLSTRQVSCLEPQLVQLYGGLATRNLLFNSAFNLDSYLAGVDGLLRKMPDALPGGIVDRLAAKAEILPVPISLTPDDVVADPRLIVWNHRWDYDKGPEVFAAAILQLHASGEAFRLALLGPRPARPPTALQQIRKACGDRILVDDKVDSGRYREILSRAGIVVSSARHEFQGLAIMEAVTAGCSPLVPDALCYPEQYAEAYRYPPGDVAALAERLRTWLHDGPPPAPDMIAWSAASLAPRWRERLHALYRQ